MAEQENQVNDELALSEWEKMLAEENKAPATPTDSSEGQKNNTEEGATQNSTQPTPTAKVLSQEEIDSLLGFSAPKEGDKNNSGIRAMLDKALQSYERLPMLEIVFDRLVRILSTSLRNYTADTVDIDIRSISSLRFGSYINSIPMPALVTVFKAIEWENFGLINADGHLIYSLVDILFGGRKANQPIKFEGRPYTTIEQGIVKQLSEIILTDLGASFDPLSPATFLFERIETNPRFATIARPGDAAILLQLRVEMEDKGGKIEILFPYATLEPIRDQLLQVFVGEKFGKDSEWESHLQTEIVNTSIEMEAILTHKKTIMGEVMSLKVGSTILMDVSPEDDIILYSSGIKMFSGKLGKLGNKIAVSINDNLNLKSNEDDTE
ncbi:MAG: flagellar motor switch protein FliM [Alphaproteobacteria bacterium]